MKLPFTSKKILFSEIGKYFAAVGNWYWQIQQGVRNDRPGALEYARPEEAENGVERTRDITPVLSTEKSGTPALVSSFYCQEIVGDIL